MRLSRELHDTLLQSLVGVALEFDAVSKSIDVARVASTYVPQLPQVQRLGYNMFGIPDFGMDFAASDPASGLPTEPRVGSDRAA